MTERPLVGTRPWLPAFLQRIPGFNEPIPAERLGALRVFVGLCWLVDLLWLYGPMYRDFYGPGSLSEPGVFREYFAYSAWRWSLYNWLGVNAVMAIGLLSAVGLTFGILSNASAAAAWAVSVSLINTYPYLHNGGDRVRSILFFALMLTPCSCAFTAGIRRPPALVYSWWRSLLIVQMCLIYFLNGIRKLPGEDWQSGVVMYYVCNNSLWAHWSGQPLQLPLPFYKFLSWFTLVWEIGFPLFLLMPITRKAILILGASFHVVTFFHLEVGMFAFYSLGFYAPLMPWEKWLKVDRDTEPIAPRVASAEGRVPEFDFNSQTRR